MKKLLLLTVLLLLVACAPAQQETTDAMKDDKVTDTEQIPETEVKEETIQEAQPPQPSVKVDDTEEQEETVIGITDETQERAESILSIAGKRTAISDGYRKFELGEIYVYSVGIKNSLISEDDFALKLDFDDARDKLGNLITSDDALVAGWVGRNNFEPFTVDAGETVYVPLYIEITQFTNGETPLPGKYNFDLRIYYKDNRPKPVQEYAKIEFTVQIS